MKTVSLILASSIVLLLFNCCEKTDIQLNKTALTLSIGETETLVATVLPDNNMTVNWTSNDTSVATIDIYGQVTAKAVGTSIITASNVNKTAKCTVTVIEEEVSIEEPEMIFVEGGTFLYGITDEEYNELSDDMKESYEMYGHYPSTLKSVSSFYISKYPVTQKLWKSVMGSLPNDLLTHNYGISDDYPVYYVNFSDICEYQFFIHKLRLATGKDYQLPSSEEWEYAARGGNKSKGYKYSGSNNIDEVAWYNGNSNGALHPVGKKKANELGIYDMSGNLWEWTRFETTYLIKTPHFYEIRGGSWSGNEHGCSVNSFSVKEHLNSAPDVGFRLVLPAQVP